MQKLMEEHRKRFGEFEAIDVVDEAEIQARCEGGDPLWNKSNAQFFERDEYSEAELRTSAMSPGERQKERMGQ